MRCCTGTARPWSTPSRAQEPSGFEVIRIDGIDTFGFAGKTITVYEKLYDEGGSLIAKHTDKDDVNQQVTVIVPEIGTTATDGADGDKLVSTDDAATVVDTVHYKNLIPGNRYALVGALFVKKTAEDGEITGEPLMVDGAPWCPTPPSRPRPQTAMP